MDPLAIELVGRANLQLRQFAKDVQEHDGQAIDAAQSGRIAGRRLRQTNRNAADAA